MTAPLDPCSFARRWLASTVWLAGLCAGCGTGAGAPPLFEAGPNSPIPVGPRPGKPTIADFNGDGKPDMIITCAGAEGSESGIIVLLLNEGKARFSPSPGGRLIVERPVDELVVVDFDGDGNADVVATGHDSYLVHLFLGDGKGGLSKAPWAPFAAHDGQRPHTHAIVAADVNGDGAPDILTTNADDDAISVLLNDGRARFAPAPGSPFAALRHPYSSLAVADFNGDGRLDVAAPLLQSGGIGVYFGDGTGRFAGAPGSPYRVAARPGFVHAADVNGDGRPDILGTHDDVGLVDVLLNDGAGGFRFAAGSPVRLDRQVWAIATSDIDGDGNVDAVLSATPGRSLVLLIGDGRGGFRLAKGVRLATGESPNRVECADLDGDGRVDIVSSNFESGDVTVLLRR